MEREPVGERAVVIAPVITSLPLYYQLLDNGNQPVSQVPLGPDTETTTMSDDDEPTLPPETPRFAIKAVEYGISTGASNLSFPDPTGNIYAPPAKVDKITIHAEIVRPGQPAPFQRVYRTNLFIDSAGHVLWSPGMMMEQKQIQRLIRSFGEFTTSQGRNIT